PARDLGPRLAHYILPIHGKGSSEWKYGLVQAVATLLGGVLAAGLYKGMTSIRRNGLIA
ncbi:hypothetical protein HK104_008950, partial [Borealophlyctis nickersoniae]